MSATYYACKEHDFSTLDPQAALKHVQGHIVDLMCDVAKRALKGRLGIPPTEQKFCNCGWAPFPHKHAPTTTVF